MDKSLDKVTKKKMIFIICIMVFFILIYVSWPNIYCMNKLDGNNVCTYGKKFTSEELIGKNNKYKNYEFQKAITGRPADQKSGAGTAFGPVFCAGNHHQPV